MKVFGMLLLALVVAAPVHAQEQQGRTRVVVRAVARDAKIIYDNVGGARITITDAAGRVLAEGEQRGGSGDTNLIMNRAPRAEGVYATEGAAAFVAELDLQAPTVVTITAEGPLQPAHAAMKSSKTMLLLPGEHVEGDGVLIELHGFIVTVTGPETLAANTPAAVTATVAMMCGCTVTAGGLWDANGIEVNAVVRRNGDVVATTRLSYAGQPNTFTGELAALPAGDYELEVTAAQAGMANFGRHVRALKVGG